MVEDNPADARLTTEALRESRLSNTLHLARDGVEAMEFLRRQGAHAEAPRSDLILLDLDLTLPDPRGLEGLERVIDAASAVPLVVLSGHTDEALGGLDHARYREYAGNIRESGVHLLELINDMLGLAKIEAARIELQECETAVDEAVAACVKLLSARLEAAELALEVDVPAGSGGGR